MLFSFSATPKWPERLRQLRVLGHEVGEAEEGKPVRDRDASVDDAQAVQVPHAVRPEPGELKGEGPRRGQGHGDLGLREDRLVNPQPLPAPRSGPVGELEVGLVAVDDDGQGRL